MNTQVAMTGGIMILVVLSIGLSFYYTKAASDAVVRSEKLLISGQNKANNRGNATIAYLDTILNQVVNNQHTIIGNITQHRVVSNFTYQHLDHELDLLVTLLGGNVTNDKINFTHAGTIASVK